MFRVFNPYFMYSPILKALYDSVNETLIVETKHGEYKGLLKSCDDCMNLHLETENGNVFINGSTIRLFILNPEKAYAPYLQ